MDERGMDKEVKKYFRKILYSISWGLIWMISMLTLGVYYQFAFPGSHPSVYTICYYVLLTVSFAFLLRYLYNSWKQGGK